jgi:hypothetical protein
MGEYYWELVQRDGTTTEVPPDLVDVIKRRMANKEPINTKSAVIPFAQIEHFRKTSKPFNTQPLIEAAAQAFKEAIFNEDGSIQAQWVKKEVTQRDYDKKYVHGYRVLDKANNMVVIAFRLPTHLIDNSVVSYLSDNEIEKLQNT